jgi:autotransporter passenger strand-loop-strand repeat protein
VVSSGGATTGTLLNGGHETVLRGGRSSGTDILSGGGEIVSSGGSALTTTISGGTLEVASGGTASGVLFSSGGILQLDASSHLSGAVSGFHSGGEIDLRGLAFSSSSSTLTWKQTTSGANATGTLTVNLLPRGAEKGVRRAQPKLVCEIAFRGWTADADPPGLL